MSSTSDTGNTSSGRKIAAIILGVIAVLFIVAGIIYLAEPAKSLPSFMGHKTGSSGHHALRMAGSFIVGQATQMRGASNEKAKRELDWKPRYASWREGFRTALG